MVKDALDSITAQLEALELDQQQELDTIFQKHRQQKRSLLKRLKRNSAAPPTTAATTTPSPVVSANGYPLHRGDKVAIKTTASIGTKGDLAIVTCVDPARVDIYIPRLNDKSWRLPKNLRHHH